MPCNTGDIHNQVLKPMETDKKEQRLKPGFPEKELVEAFD